MKCPYCGKVTDKNICPKCFAAVKQMKEEKKK